MIICLVPLSKGMKGLLEEQGCSRSGAQERERTETGGLHAPSKEVWTFFEMQS